jgi:hypothetical protein
MGIICILLVITVIGILALPCTLSAWTEHILQFGINIDDEKIKNTVMTKVDKVVHEIVKGDVIEALTGNRNNSDYTYS